MARLASMVPDEIIDTPTRATITLHVLAPSLPPPSRFTLRNVPLSLTVRQLNSRIQLELPSNPPVHDQRLIYNGRLINSLGPLSIIFPPNSEEVSIHLALPPSPIVPAATARTAAEIAHDEELLYGNRALDEEVARAWPGIHHRVSAHAPTLANGASARSASVNHRVRRETVPNADIQHPSQTQGRAADVRRSVARPAELQAVNNARNINALMPYLVAFERLLAQNNLPDVESQIQFRSLVDACRLSRVAPEIFQRINNVYRRIDYLALPTMIHQIGLEPGRRYYLMADAQGHQALLYSSESAGAEPVDLVSTHPFLDALAGAPVVPQHRDREPRIVPVAPAAAHVAAPTAAPTAAHAAVPARQNAPGVIDTLRIRARAHNHAQDQAQERAPDRRAAHRRLQITEYFMRLLSSMWLFSQFMLVIYMTSDSGTWTRTIMMAVFMLYALLQATGLTDQFRDAISGPFRRFMERQVIPVVQPQEGRPANSFVVYFAESAMLLLASLVPGIGERRVQAEGERLRNQMEDARLRQALVENERLREAAAQAQAQAQAQVEPEVPTRVASPYDHWFEASQQLDDPAAAERLRVAVQRLSETQQAENLQAEVEDEEEEEEL